MYNAIFYIFFVFIIISLFSTAFSVKKTNSVFSLFIIMISTGGIFALLNSELISFLLISSTSIVFLLSIVFQSKINSSLFEDIEKSINPGYYFIFTVSSACALISGIVSSTRWKIFGPDYSINSYSLIFIKYLPVFLALILLSSVILSSYAYLKESKETG